ncbi:hypothetical protein BDV93DRAFT_525028 [Ceratobasidium sp. AG-I]|nr:hypothetical protein BDV93DRAFT_525028 [Ceratobasidium sp. AG-I]
MPGTSVTLATPCASYAKAEHEERRPRPQRVARNKKAETKTDDEIQTLAEADPSSTSRHTSSRAGLGRETACEAPLTETESRVST